MLTEQIRIPSLNTAFAASVSSQGTETVPEVRKACQLQLGQLAAQLPIAIAWLVYQTPKGDRWELRLLCTQTLPDLNHSTLTYLESEAWLHHYTPNQNLQPLSGLGQAVYVCWLGAETTQSNYLLLWTQTPLTETQNSFVEQQAQLLSYWLQIDAELSRQRGEIQLLEQVLQKAEHQLRNPLALISLHAENLRLGLPEGLFRDQAVLIRDTVGDLSNNLTELLHCSQRTRLRLEVSDVRSLLAETLDSLQPWLKAKQLRVDLPAQALPLRMDRWQIKQVLVNLLHNAIHFSPTAGVITWEWHTSGQMAQISIRDRGVGLSAEDLRQALTPYYSRRLGGTGLGLAIAHKIILDHRGSLWATNHPEGGAQFCFTLPLH